MSTNNSQKDFNINKDKIISSKTIHTEEESIIVFICKNKNIYLITKFIEERISDILSYLYSDENLAKNKIIIVKYLQELFMNVEFNSEIFLRETINKNKKLNLYKIIISQYIFYINPSNSKEDEENYKDKLRNLFLLLLSQISPDKDTYHYILFPLINFIHEKKF